MSIGFHLSRYRTLTLLLTFATLLPAARIPGRYIVELNTEPVAERVARLGGRNRMASPVAATHRARLASEQKLMRSRLEQRRVRVIESASTVANALFVEASEQAAAELAALPGVKRVSPVREVRMLLDSAVLVHRVADAWNRLGGPENAGAGIKVAIIDSGIDTGHAAFQDQNLKAPDGFPKVSSEEDLANTSAKIVVARSYVPMLTRRDPDNSARDRVGHGTALAMIVAGVRNAAPRATLTGVAPKAFLGNYKVFGSPNVNDGSTEDAIIKAIDDAVADGMDVINLSLGTDIPFRLEFDPVVDAVERATQAGVIVVTAAGNNGPAYTTISSPSTAPSSIAAGSISNGRKFASSVEAPGAGFFLAIAGDNSAAAVPVTGPLADVAALDQTGLACEALPEGSLGNSIALILRGTCTFEIKLQNARAAGAIGAVVYAAESSPAAIAMGMGTATLPAEMVSHQDGLALKQVLGTVVTLRFTVSAVPWPSGRRSDFSASGPNVNAGIKPDVMAVGDDVYTATQTLDPAGDMYSSNGFILVGGTSFSCPLVAGAAALLKAARPDLTVDQYRSLLINTATEAHGETGGASSVQQTGAGTLDLDAAVRSTVAAYPTSFSLGAGGANLNSTYSLFLKNLGRQEETFEIGFDPRAGQRVGSVETASVRLPAGGSIEIPVRWSGSDLTAGAQEGLVVVHGTTSGTTLRIPYWYDVISDKPAGILVLDSIATARRGSVQNDAILFRVTDAAGLPIVAIAPEVTVTSGDSKVRGVVSYDEEVPGLFGVNLDAGLTAGTHVVQIKAGEIVRQISIVIQ